MRYWRVLLSILFFSALLAACSAFKPQITTVIEQRVIKETEVVTAEVTCIVKRTKLVTVEVTRVIRETVVVLVEMPAQTPGPDVYESTPPPEAPAVPDGYMFGIPDSMKSPVPENGLSAIEPLEVSGLSLSVMILFESMGLS